MKNQKYIIIISGIVIILFSYFLMNYLSGFGKSSEKPQEKQIFRYVKAEKVKYADLSGKITTAGRVYSKSEVALSSEVSGKIIEGNIPFKKGQNFRKGDLLLKIYDKEAGLSLKANKSSFLNALAGLLPDLKIDFKDNYKNWYSFFEQIDIEKDLPKMPEIKSTKEKVFLASRNILSSYYNIKSAESTFKKHFIYAPFTGSITFVNGEVGGFAGRGTRLGNLINTLELELEVPLKLENAKWVKKGDKVEVKNETGTEKWIGRVIRKSSSLTENQSINIFVQILNNQNTPLYKGQYLKAYFNTVEISNVMEIPRNAIFNSDEVFLVKENLLKKETIDVVKLNETTAFIRGLEENDFIVTEPLVNATENTKVKILEK